MDLINTTNNINCSSLWNWNSWRNLYWCVNPHYYMDDDNYGTHNGYVALPLDCALVTNTNLNGWRNTVMSAPIDDGDFPISVPTGFTYARLHTIDGNDYMVIGFDSVHYVNSGDNVTDALITTMNLLRDVWVYNDN